MDATWGNAPLYHPQHNGYRIAINYKNRGFKANLLGVMASGINTGHGVLFSDTDTLFSYPSNRYAVLDFNLTYDVNDHLSCYFKALNLTNQCYSNYTSELIYSDGIKSVHHSPGRSFVYGVEARF